tara:strand:+ start:2531 stop:2923 length:393 start_codon:yes stop_codon:yes gene_type:complete
MIKRILLYIILAIFLSPLTVEAFASHGFKHSFHHLSDKEHAQVEHSHDIKVITTIHQHPIIGSSETHFKDYLPQLSKNIKTALKKQLVHNSTYIEHNPYSNHEYTNEFISYNLSHLQITDIYLKTNRFRN